MTLKHPANDPSTVCPDCRATYVELIPVGKLVGCCVCGKVFNTTPKAKP